MSTRSVSLISMMFLFGCSKEEPAPATAATAGDIVLESPAAASWMPAGAADVDGIATDVDTVDVNGVPVALADGRFSGQVTLTRGVNVIEAVGTEADGDQVFARSGVLAGPFADPSGAVEDAMSLRLNRSGIEELMDLVAGMIAPAALSDAAAGMNPVYEDSYGVWGWDAIVISADVVGISFGTPQLSAEPGMGELTIEIALPNLQVDLDAYGEAVGFDFDTTASLMAERAVVRGEIELGADRGALAIELENAEVELEGFSYDTSALPGDVESWLFVDTIRAKIEEMVLAEIETLVPALLDETLSGLDPSFAVDLLGKELEVAAEFADAGIDRDGVWMAMDIDAYISSDGSFTYAGYLTSQGGDPELDTGADLTGAISDDLLNRLFFEAWRGGMLRLSLSTDDGSLLPGMLEMLHADEGTITVDAKLPPVIIQVDGGLQVQAGEVDILIETPGGELGESVRVSANVFADVTLAVDDGTLELSPGDVSFTLMVRESDWGASDEAITNLVQEALPIDTLMLLLNAINFELPTLYGVSIESAELVRDDSEVYSLIRVEMGQE